MADAEAVKASELLDRVERQAQETERATVRIEQLERALEAERSARRDLDALLARERKTAADLRSQLDAHTAADAESQEGAERLEDLQRHLERSWAEVHRLKLQLAQAERPLWRRLARRPG